MKIGKLLSIGLLAMVHFAGAAQAQSQIAVG